MHTIFIPQLRPALLFFLARTHASHDIYTSRLCEMERNRGAMANLAGTPLTYRHALVPTHMILAFPITRSYRSGALCPAFATHLTEACARHNPLALTLFPKLAHAHTHPMYLQMVRSALVLAAAAAAALASVSTAAAQQVAYLDATSVYTADERNPTAEAFVVDQGRFVFVGSNADALSRYPNAQQQSLAGQTVLPGLHDAHGHLAGLGLSLLGAQLQGYDSLDEMLTYMLAYAEERGMDPAAGDVLSGSGWDHERWPGQEGFPTRFDLDAVFPDLPVYITRVDAHR